MKKLSVGVFLIILQSIHAQTFGQQGIKYGNNNGSYITVTNTRIYYEEYGKGTPLILLHGGLGDISDFSKCIPELSKKFHIIAPDAPGQGRSQMTDSLSYELLTDRVSSMIDLLHLDSAYVMGWSDGGITALMLAAKRPDKIKKVLAAGANYKLSGLAPSDTNWLMQIPKDYQPSPEQKTWIENYFIANPNDWIKIVNDVKKMWGREIYFPKNILGEIKIPVILVFGDKDDVTLEHGVEMFKLLKHGQLLILPNTTHAVFFERPNIINGIATDFFGNSQ